MSGFDFDALRDPEAPFPGERERAGVEARARALRARASRNRALTGGAAVIVAVALVVGVVASRRNPGPAISVGSSTTTTTHTTSTRTPASAVDGRFIPPTSTVDGRVVLPVTLPDGEQLTLRYPPQLRIAQLGFTGTIGVNYPVSTGSQQCCGSQVTISYTTIAQTFGDAQPIAVYQGADGQRVPFYHASQLVGSPPTDKEDLLAFQFGPWLVEASTPQVADQFDGRMTAAELAVWARSLTGTLDANGYLVLHARAPLSVNDGFDGAFGAPVSGANQVELAAHLYCTGPSADTSVHRRSVSAGETTVGWCDGDLHVSATGSTSFVNLVDHSLEVSPLPPPSTASTSTTTTAPARPSAPAESASFVSSSQGFVLEQDGSIAETTDAGATWTRAGSLGTRGQYDKIRFIGPSDGFAFGADAGPLLITHDAGAHWITLDTPFSTVYDLAISRGVVYVVGVPSAPGPNGAFPGFRIWSTQVGHLNWAMDPLKIPVGAGPIPQMQLVFAGSSGWLVEVDRTVITGARLAATGAWKPWTPPCSTLNGPAYLAASSPTDLVASCDEGEWGPPTPAQTIYTSHDGGNTFTRRLAPTFGPIFAPDSHSAVVAGDGELQRTTDSGATWHTVAHLRPVSSTDGGFTTTSQGFVIFGDGTLVMTYDAGATWSPVTLP